MVFEFTGEPPTLGAPPTFASFTPTPTANTPTRTGFATTPFGAYFGSNASLRPNSTTPTPFATTTIHAQAFRDATQPDEDIPQDDDLMRALKRCATNRRAVFGRRDMDADAALNEVLGLCEVDAGKLMKALRKANSQIGVFARAVFSQLLQQGPGVKSSGAAVEKGEEKIEEGVPRWLSGEKRVTSKSPQAVAKKRMPADEDVITESPGDEEVVEAIVSTDTTPTKPFRFLDLPAEMRNIVYRELLVSKTGYIWLAGRPYTYGDTASGKFQPELRKGLKSGCDSAILGSCKQIYDEAKDILYSDNKVIMSFEVEKSMKPFLPMGRIELPSLARITSLVLVLDMCAAGSIVRTHRSLNAQDLVKLVCWRELQAMTALKHLRITIVERTEIEHRQIMLLQIMERIPTTCEVTFGMETDFEKEYVKKIIADADEPQHKFYYNLEDSYEADVDMVRKCGEGAVTTKGCKSGDTRDYRFADRDFSKLRSLAGSETINPQYVFGSGC